MVGVGSLLVHRSSSPAGVVIVITAAGGVVVITAAAWVIRRRIISAAAWRITALVGILLALLRGNLHEAELLLVVQARGKLSSRVEYHADLCTGTRNILLLLLTLALYAQLEYAQTVNPDSVAVQQLVND